MTESQRQSMQEAREALIKARDVGVWGTKNLNRNRKETAKTLAALDQHQHVPEVADFLRRVRQDLSRVDSRELHYMQRRYRDGRQISGLSEFDDLFSRVMQDPASRVYRRHGLRYQIRSEQTGWIAIIDPDGTRVSLYPNLDDELGDPLWTLKDLIP